MNSQRILDAAAALRDITQTRRQLEQERAELEKRIADIDQRLNRVDESRSAARRDLVDAALGDLQAG